MPEHLRQYWRFRDEISVNDGVLYCSHQLIVPLSLREGMSHKIHKAHQVADSSIRKAHKSLFWPGMQAPIKEKWLSCELCAQYISEQPQEPMKSHTIPLRPWWKISADLFLLDGNNYLVMVDHYSHYLELDSFSVNTSANSVIRAMEQQFAHHWIPDELITTNGPQGLLKIWATMVKSPPYYSRGNGKAELAVKIAKNILKKSWKEDPYMALLAHRNTPQQGYNYSPAQCLMSRRLKDINSPHWQHPHVWCMETSQKEDEDQWLSTTRGLHSLLESSQRGKECLWNWGEDISTTLDIWWSYWKDWTYLLHCKHLNRTSSKEPLTD